jgi:hypothetical protein
VIAVQDIWRFRDALHYGNFHNANRAIFSMSFNEAMDLWRDMVRDEERRYLVCRNLTLTEMNVEQVPGPDPLPKPIPGRIWGSVYGIKVFVEDPNETY